MRYVVGVLIAIGLVIVILVLLFSGGGQPGPKPVNLDKLANTGAEVKLVTEGELVADSERREIVITISRDTSRLQVIKGYQGQVIKVHTIANNEAAFATFLRGLTLSGFNMGDNNPDLRDERGHCPLGKRYLYEVVSAGGKTLQRYWSDTCGGGTSKGSSGTIQTLFQNQIPNYFDLTRDVDLSA